MFHLGEYTNAAAEGENIGIKTKADVTVGPQMETFSTATILTLNGMRKEKNRVARNTISSISSKPYSIHKFANKLVNNAEVHIEDQMKLSKNYINIHVDGNKYFVTRDYKNHPPKKLRSYQDLYGFMKFHIRIIN